jgi:hypothetical protein
MSDDKIVPIRPQPMFAAEGGAHTDAPVLPPDLFDVIIKQLMTDTAMVTAPGAIDPRWPTLIAQAYREGIAQLVAGAPGGVLMKMEGGSLAIYALSESVPVPE